MKINICTLLTLVLFSNSFALETIENPEYGLNTTRGLLTKIELLNTETVLHFHIKTYPDSKILISSKSYLEAVGSDRKQLVTKANGIELDKESIIPESGELFYTLHFPKLDDNVIIIDFVGISKKEDESIYDIVIDEDKVSVLPKALRGNWMLTDGSNLWDYGFYVNNAIIDRAVWMYKSVRNEGNNYTITLEREGAIKTIYANVGLDKSVSFGGSPNELKTYRLEKTHNPNYKLKNDLEYESKSLFQMDSTTYSGVIKGYSERLKEKIAVTIYIQDAFTLKVEPRKAEIRNDGSFSIKFPANYPQIILVFSPYDTHARYFVEPGKETFHFATDNTSLFMGDCALLNSGLKEMKPINSFLNPSIMKVIGENTINVSPEEHQKACLEIRVQDLNTLKELREKRFISKKALQVKKMQIEFSAIGSVMNYERSRDITIKMMASKTENNLETLIKDFKIDASFYNFIPKELLDNRLGLLASPWYGFVTEQLSSANSFSTDTSLNSSTEKKIEAHFGLSKSFAVDYMRFQRAYAKFINSYETLTDSEIKIAIEEINDPFLSNYIALVNEKAKITIASNKLKTGSNIHTLQNVDGEELFEALIKKFKGKVIYVDFWATWCGNCLPAFIRIAPLKEEMKDENIVFLHITHERSPEGQWKDVIADVKGEHYRIPNSEWNYLLKKFNISGIPRYMLVDKKGNLVNSNIGHPSNDELKVILKKEIAR